jgi:hypothetical protein
MAEHQGNGSSLTHLGDVKIGGVVFATPSYSHLATLDYLSSALSVEQLITKMGIPHAWLLRGGDPYLAKVRNRLVTEFLRDFPDMENLFFLDDDVGFPAQKVIEFLLRPEDVVCGIYPKKSEKVDFPVHLSCDRATGNLIEQNGMIGALAVGAGFLRIKRHVLEKMADEAMKYTESLDEPLEYFYNIFSMGMGDDGQWWGEDYVFCKKWTNMGGKIWVDPDIDFTHRGTRGWQGNLSKHLQTYRDQGLALFGAGALAQKEAAE